MPRGGPRRGQADPHAAAAPTAPRPHSFRPLRHGFSGIIARGRALWAGAGHALARQRGVRTVSDVKKWETMKRNAEQALKRNLPERERRIELRKLKEAIQQIRLLSQRGATAGK